MADLERLLIECLDALEQGETVETILSRYPAAADELRPLLKTAVLLADRPLQPTLAAQKQSRDTFLHAAQSLTTSRRSAGPAPFARWLRGWLALAALLLVVLLGGSMLADFLPQATPVVPGQGHMETNQPTMTVTPTMAETATAVDTPAAIIKSPTPTLTPTTTPLATQTPAPTPTSDDSDHTDDSSSDDKDKTPERDETDEPDEHDETDEKESESNDNLEESKPDHD